MPPNAQGMMIGQQPSQVAWPSASTNTLTPATTSTKETESKRQAVAQPQQAPVQEDLELNGSNKLSLLNFNMNFDLKNAH